MKGITAQNVTLGCHFILLSVCFICEARGSTKFGRKRRGLYLIFVGKINNFKRNHSNVWVINPTNIQVLSSTRPIKNKSLWGGLILSSSSGGKEIGILFCLAL